MSQPVWVPETYLMGKQGGRRKRSAFDQWVALRKLAHNLQKNLRVGISVDTGECTQNFDVSFVPPSVYESGGVFQMAASLPDFLNEDNVSFNAIIFMGSKNSTRVYIYLHFTEYHIKGLYVKGVKVENNQGIDLRTGLWCRI